MGKRRILSIDGGGIRGIIPAMILAKIEEMTSKPVHKLFDLIAGTSTGSIIALALNMPSSENKDLAAYTAGQLVNLYTEKGSKIFSTNIFHKIATLDGITDERYKSSGIESVLKEAFGETMLSEALTPVLIPAYEIGLRTPFFFKSRHAKNPDKKNYDFKMWQVARASSAAPTYFEPFKIDLEGAEADYYAFIDGGVYANNPAMCAFAEAKVMFGNDDDILMVSLGTGELSRGIPYEEARDWGLINWAKPMLGIVFDGVSNTVDYQLRQLLSDNRYYRIQSSLAELGRGMDDASDENIHQLKLLGHKTIEEWLRNGKLDKLCSQLV
mgnify:CR=1 FL=1